MGDMDWQFRQVNNIVMWRYACTIHHRTGMFSHNLSQEYRGNGDIKTVYPYKSDTSYGTQIGLYILHVRLKLRFVFKNSFDKCFKCQYLVIGKMRICRRLFGLTGRPIPLRKTVLGYGLAYVNRSQTVPRV